MAALREESGLIRRPWPERCSGPGRRWTFVERTRQIRTLTPGSCCPPHFSCCPMARPWDPCRDFSRIGAMSLRRQNGLDCRIKSSNDGSSRFSSMYGPFLPERVDERRELNRTSLSLIAAPALSRGPLTGQLAKGSEMATTAPRITTSSVRTRRPRISAVLRRGDKQNKVQDISLPPPFTYFRASPVSLSPGERVRERGQTPEVCTQF